MISFKLSSTKKKEKHVNTTGREKDKNVRKYNEGFIMMKQLSQSMIYTILTLLIQMNHDWKRRSPKRHIISTLCRSGKSLQQEFRTVQRQQDEVEEDQDQAIFSDSDEEDLTSDYDRDVSKNPKSYEYDPDFIPPKMEYDVGPPRTTRSKKREYGGASSSDVDEEENETDENDENGENVRTMAQRPRKRKFSETTSPSRRRITQQQVAQQDINAAQPRESEMEHRIVCPFEIFVLMVPGMTSNEVYNNFAYVKKRYYSRIQKVRILPGYTLRTIQEKLLELLGTESEFNDFEFRIIRYLGEMIFENVRSASDLKFAGLDSLVLLALF